MTTHDSTNHPNGWLTIREAALALGTSELTVRRRIKDGRLTGRLENGKYYVRLTDRSDEPAPSLEVSPEAHVAPTNGGAAPVDMAAILAEQTRLAELAGRASFLQEHLRALEERYTALQEGALALANRNGWLESKLEEREEEIKLLEDSRQKASWLKRLFSRA